MFEYNFTQTEKFHPLFQAVENCRRVEQLDCHHPEGDVFNHSIQILHWALKESKDIDLIVAAWLHDVGKLIGSLGHEKYSVELLKGLISEKTEWLILNHMRFWAYINGEMKRYQKVQDFSSHKWLSDLTLLCRWDKLARNPNFIIKYDRETILSRLNKAIVNNKNKD